MTCHTLNVTDICAVDSISDHRVALSYSPCQTGLIEVHNIASGRRTWSSGVAGPTDGAEPFRLGVTLSGDLVGEYMRQMLIG